MHILLLWCVSVSVMSTVQIIFTKKQSFLYVKSKKCVDETYITKRYLNEIFQLFQNEQGESKKTDFTFWTKTVSHEIGEKLVLPASEDQGIQVTELFPRDCRKELRNHLSKSLLFSDFN